MNKYTKTSFENIQKSAKDYQHATTSALYKFRQTMERAEQNKGKFKDEAAYMEQERKTASATARQSIKMAENIFTGEVQAEIDSLRKDLAGHLVTAPSQKFLDALGVYDRFNLRPSKAEITAMLEHAAGNSLSLRALNSVLERVGSEYKITAPGAADYEADIAALEYLAAGNLMAVEHDYWGEATKAYQGEKRLTRRKDNSFYDGGYRWDNLSVMLAAQDFSSRIDKLPDMATRWDDNVLPTIFKADVYTGYVNENGEDVTGAQEFVDDYHSTAQAAQIEHSDVPVEMIRHIKEQGEVAAKAQETIKAYLK